ncbi:hypothetical protein CWI38_0008p0100 [Hamiltosporidium tvaerminnensis]|uniref:Uncharacterized protein n=1 Tax=Hamiltosporidium tvaerminnensis TaxID=1176355 RepID=A0A4Q9M403_9MICR|nr:hypothetical protein CWI38_0008p0100 [Hamiltosporidium tvaerminnensis]
MVDEIVFFWCYISDEVIRALNANLNLVNLKKIVFIESEFDTVFIFTEHLSNIEEFIFYEKHYYERYTAPEIKEGDLNIAENMIESFKHAYQKHSIEENLSRKIKIYQKKKKISI